MTAWSMSPPTAGKNWTKLEQFPGVPEKTYVSA